MEVISFGWNGQEIKAVVKIEEQANYVTFRSLDGRRPGPARPATHTGITN